MDADFLQRGAEEVAPELIGWTLTYRDQHGQRGGVIVETEAYTASDPASHSYRGPTARNAPMWLGAGTLYVYTIYGLHRCFNLVCGAGDGQAVLIRALEPTIGLEFMQRQRQTAVATDLCSGPAKLVQALALPASLNGQPLPGSGLELTPPSREYSVHKSPRIGITRAAEIEWRFYAADSPHVSRAGSYVGRTGKHQEL